MIKPVVQGGIRIPTIEVAGGCRNNDERKRDTDGQTKQDGFHCSLLSSPASPPNLSNHAALCWKPAGLEKIPQPDNFKNMYRIQMMLTCRLRHELPDAIVQSAVNY